MQLQPLQAWKVPQPVVSSHVVLGILGSTVAQRQLGWLTIAGPVSALEMGRSACFWHIKLRGAGFRLCTNNQQIRALNCRVQSSSYGGSQTCAYAGTWVFACACYHGWQERTTLVNCKSPSASGSNPKKMQHDSNHKGRGPFRATIE